MVIDLALAFRSKSQRVLIASLFCNTRVEFFKRIASHSVINVAAGILGIVDQPRELAVEIARAGCNGIDRDVVAKKLRKGLVVTVGVEFRAILAVADQQDNFPAIARTVLQQLRGIIDGVIQSLGGLALDSSQAPLLSGAPGAGMLFIVGPLKGPPGGGNGSVRSNFGTSQFGYELFLIGRKAFAWIKELIEAADECLIVRAQAPNNGAQTGLNLVRIFGA